MYDPPPAHLPRRASRLVPAERSKGLAIALLSVLVITPDAMFIRWAKMLGASIWQIIFWKYLAASAIGISSGVCLLGGLGPALEGTLAAPGHVLFASLLQMLSQIGFNIAFLKTSPARAMLFISLNPLWTGLLGRVCLGEVLPTRTLVALLFGAVSSLIVFIPALVCAAAGEASDAGSIAGDLIAVATGMVLATYVTFMRYTLHWRAEASIDLSAGLGNALCCAAMLLVLISTESGLTHNLGTTFVAVITVDAICISSFYVGFTVAPRYLVGAQLALILLLQTLMTPLWVFLKFGDVPSSWTLGGGALLLLTLAAHELVSLCGRRADTESDDFEWPSPSVSESGNGTVAARGEEAGAASLNGDKDGAGFEYRHFGDAS